ncbi:MAG: hypothetical protein WCJ55_15075, partial [Chloroflexales bacterium]
PRFLWVFGGFAAKNPQKKTFRGWLCYPQTPAGGDVATARRHAAMQQRAAAQRILYQEERRACARR